MSTDHSPEGWIAEQDSMKVEKSIASMTPAGHQFTKTYAGGDPYFGLWLSLVDRRIRKYAGVSVADLEDWMSRDCYESGASPRDGMIEALSNDDLYAGHLDELGITAGGTS